MIARFSLSYGPAVAGAVAVLLVIAPLFGLPAYIMSTLTIALILVMLTCSWDILTGFTGQVSFGHAAFFGLGAYSAVLPIHHFGITPWAALVLGPIGSAVLGLGVGLICLRLRGPYLALMTLALAQIVQLLIITNTDITRGQLGISGYGGLMPPNSRLGYYYIALAFAIFIVGALALFARSRYGVILRTIRDDEVKAECVGVDTVRYKIFAFVLSSFIAGLAGAMYAFFVQVLTPEAFDVRFSALPIGMAILGGAGTIFGPALFTVVFHFVADALKPVGAAYDLLLLGVVILVAVMYLPRGLWPLLTRTRRARGTGADDVALAGKASGL